MFHKISRKINNYCVENNFGTIILGYNKTWKQNINIGIVNNQNFVQVPFLKLLNQINHKSELAGIDVIKEKESFTSKCSFLDEEAVKKHRRYEGMRLKRGLFKTKSGVIINADVNAGYNIIKKTIPNAVSVDGI
jgi:putative transposase